MTEPRETEQLCLELALLEQLLRLRHPPTPRDAAVARRRRSPRDVTRSLQRNDRIAIASP